MQNDGRSQMTNDEAPMTKEVRSALITMVFFCGLVVASADNWPQFRGPTGIGYAHEESRASAAVSDGQIFIRGNKHLYCIGNNSQRAQ
jgi:hypothetical protein